MKKNERIEVSLEQMLAVREARAFRQQELLSEFSRTVISFTMNIAGPVKISVAIERAFSEGLSRLSALLAASGHRILHKEERREVTGCEALWVTDGNGTDIKRLCLEAEDADTLSRLFDLDVIDPEKGLLSREQFGLPPRSCLVCGKEGKGCASRRLHSFEEVSLSTTRILDRYFAEKDAEEIAATAARALLYEVCTTPKPGLVDRANNGSHSDMNLFTFLDSTAALFPYFRKAVRIGQCTGTLPAEESFRRLRQEGILAEAAMFAATNGVNTHKGAVFSLGTVCAAAGRLWESAGCCRELPLLLKECAAMTEKAAEADFAAITEETAASSGQRIYLNYGLRGIRGEVADGFPSVASVAMPAFTKALKEGASLEEAGVITLLSLIAETPDTNLISRGGLEGLRWANEAAKQAMKKNPDGTYADRTLLDREFIARNLSPGGCADLLAITYFLYFITENPEIS